MNEKKLREALVKTRERLRMFNYQPRELDDIADYIGHVLTSVGPKTEMEKLLQWADEKASKATKLGSRLEVKMGRGSIEGEQQLNFGEAYMQACHRIATEFGYKLPQIKGSYRVVTWYERDREYERELSGYDKDKRK